MIATSISYCQFHVVRLLRLQPGASIAVAFGSLVLLASLIAFVAQWRLAQDAAQELASMHLNVLPSKTKDRFDTGFARPDLPEFNSGALVSMLNKRASEIAVPLDEVTYVLDESANQPFLRYRVTLSIATSYSLTRRFIGDLGVAVPNMMLDAISCTRENIALPTPTCDLAFSAFYRKGGRG
ncbi:MAG: hypothetical protein V4463_24840 [Pseudomonadota bacterium]